MWSSDSGMDFSLSLPLNLREDFSLRDGDSFLDVFVEPSSYRHFISYWMYFRGSTGHIDGIAVLSLCGMPWYAVSTLRRPLNFSSTQQGFSSSEGAQGGERAPTRGTVFFCSGTPLAVTGGLSAALFVAVLLMEVTTFWVGARWLQVQFLVSFFRSLQGEAQSHVVGRFFTRRWIV